MASSALLFLSGFWLPLGEGFYCTSYWPVFLSVLSSLGVASASALFIALGRVGVVLGVGGGFFEGMAFGGMGGLEC